MLSQGIFAAAFKWVDADGNTHFGDKPPQTAETEEITLRQENFVSQKTQRKIEYEESYDVVIYVVTVCPICKQAKDYFDEHDVDYKLLNIEKDPAAKEAFEAINGARVPLIIVGGDKRLVGFSVTGFTRIYGEKEE